VIGTPPCNGVKSESGKATIAVRPFLMMSSNAFVGRLNKAAVRALPMEMLAPAANVPSSRSSAIRLPPSSTTAMTPPGALSFLASTTAAAMTFFAPSSVSVAFCAVCACAAAASAASTKVVTSRFRVIFITSPSLPSE
jgi:hypothetical protein